MVTILPSLPVMVRARWPRSVPGPGYFGAGGFGRPPPVQGEQRNQRMLWRWPKTVGDQHLAEFIAVQPSGLIALVTSKDAGDLG